MKTKQLIQKHALENFVRKGYEGASLHDIAQAIGIQKQSIYSHFKNKDDLFLTVVQQVIGEEISFLHQFFSNKQEELKTFLMGFVFRLKERFINTDDQNIKFIFRMAYMPPEHLRENLIKQFNLYFSDVEELVINAFLDNGYARQKAEQITLTYMTILDGLIIALIYGGVERFDKKSEAVWRTLWQKTNN